MLTCFSKSSSRFADSSTVMPSVSCPSNSEIGHWVPRWRVSYMSAVADPLFCWHPWITSPVLTFPRCLYDPLRFFYRISATLPPDSHMTQYFRSSTPFLIPWPTAVNPTPPSSFVAQKKVRNSSLVRPSRQAVLWSSNFFGFRNGHIFITYFNYDTKKQTTSFRSRDDDDVDLPRLRNSSSQLIPSMT